MLNSTFNKRRSTNDSIYYHNQETKNARSQISRDELLESARGNPEEQVQLHLAARSMIIDQARMAKIANQKMLRNQNKSHANTSIVQGGQEISTFERPGSKLSTRQYGITDRNTDVTDRSNVVNYSNN